MITAILAVIFIFGGISVLSGALMVLWALCDTIVSLFD